MDVFDQLKAQMRGIPSEIPKGAIVVDVRSTAEFQMGHVEGALNIPVEMISPQNIAPLNNDQNQTIIVYCASGMRSAYARTMLIQLGFTNVINGGTAHETAELIQKNLVR